MLLCWLSALVSPTRFCVGLYRISAGFHGCKGGVNVG
jgi:hypothetical protein